MLARIVAVLSGVALLSCSWWMVDRNNADPEGEVSLDIVAMAPGGSGNPVTVIAMGGDEGTSEVTLPQLQEALGEATITRGPACAGLPAIGQLLEPAPHWVPVDGPDHTSACLLSGRWRLADLVGKVDDTLSVKTSGGRLRLEYEPGLPASSSVIDFDLQVRFPADVEAVDGAATLSGHSVHWAGTKSLRSGSHLGASSRVVPFAQETAPWLVGMFALLTIAAGAFWPRPRTLIVDAAVDDRSDGGAEGGAAKPPEGPAPHPSPAAVAPKSRTSPVGPDPDSPWRPPTSA